ncbi:cytochrome b561 and DOMON domain-containing protein At5g47530-like [Sesamum indicum]|uniref:Cytochrome b561 and DOMON domain-containing protein n=1 Tax=Sesamum indicum TaxID=4182 RepID=A0A6I9UZB4_SESIN|nr:cytochrome b561 and DOMON domain-containing protein At5g47530-like [Sesamum indicum]
MDKFSKNIVLLASFLIIFLTASSSRAQNCSDYRFSNNNIYKACNSLPALNSFLHWNYHQSSHTVDLAYRQTGITASNWVAWSINPGGGAMIGAQSLVAFRNSSGLLRAYTSPISSYGTRLEEGPLSFRVPGIAAEFTNNQMIIYATIELPRERTSFIHVWQHGSTFGNTPLMHSMDGEHVRSVGTIDFSTGLTTNVGTATSESRRRIRNVHGVLNVVSWGIMMPIGAMAARYLKVFKVANPAWFYLHITCQSSAYIMGVVGWGLGLKLGHDSPGVQGTAHRNIGITLFILATIQVFALFLRPKPDHKYRSYWNMYHHSIGYTVIVLSIVNIFEGLDKLDPEKKWKRAYAGVLIFLGAIALLLEAYTWYVVLKGRRQSTSDKHPQEANGVNGA